MVNDKLEEKRKHGNFLLPLGIYDVNLGDKEYSISAHWHKEIEIILVNTGEFNLQINSDFYTCKCGDIVIINCEELHYLIAKESVYSEFTSLVFDISQLNSSILDSSSVNFITPIINKKFKLPTIINENSNIYNNLKEIFLKIIEVYSHKYYGFELEIKALLFSFFANIFREETPAVIVARGLEIPEEMLQAAKENGVAVLQGRNSTSSLSGDMSWYLNSQLAERTSVHGVLVDIYGMGVLIQGDSGIGKSETALELVKRGHRLVADDRVDVYAKDEGTLWGEPAEILLHLLEIRGVGIIDVMSLYGASAVRDSSQVQLCICLEHFENDEVFDRLGNSNEEIELQGVKIPRIRIPVKTGRNVSVVIEAAAMNYRAKQMGYDATKTFKDRLTDLISKNGED